MVSILPSNRSPWEAISQSLGQGLSQTLPQAAMQRSQRETGLGAIDQLQRDLQSSGGDISTMLPSLARAITLNQNLERSGLGQEFLKNAAAGKYPMALGEGSNQNVSQASSNPSIVAPISAETQQEHPPSINTEKTHPSIDAVANQYLAEVRPDLINPSKQFGAINTFDSAIQQDLSPQEESQLRQQLMDKYKNMNVVNQVVDRVREGVKNKYNEALAKYDFDKDKLNQIKEKWNNFTLGSSDRLAPHTDKYGENFPKTKEVLTNKYNQYASKLPTNMTPEDMHANAMALVQRDINKIDALAAQPAMPPVRGNESVKEYIDTYKKDYRDLADQGFTEALREDAFNNKDMGNEEFHAMIWGDQTNNTFLNKINSLKAPKEYSQFSSKGNAKHLYNKNYNTEHEKYISDLSKSFKDLKPEDDLVLTRAMVLDGGGEIKDFNQALQKAQQDGLKLSEFQNSQLQETSIPRVPPLWELFSKYEGDNPLLGIFGNLGWKSFINYLRGKK